MKNNKGISLIVLIITIIVIIILAGAVILSLSANNPISQASKATYLSDVKNFETELELYKGKQFVDNTGVYDPTLLQADNDSVTYNGVLDTSKTMKDLIPSLASASKYNGQFQVIDGKLIYGGLDTNRQNWTREVGLEVVIIGEPKITILSPSPILAQRGTNIIYTVKFSSNLALTTINLASKVVVLDDAGVALTVQPVISIGTVSGSATDTTRQVDITITTDNLVNGSYKLKIKPGVVTNSNSIYNTIDTISLIEFDILDNIPPVNPTMSAIPTGWTNGNVSVTINYSADSVTKEYSTNGTTWSNYTVPVVVTANTTTVYARGKDIATNESGVATLTVANIDKTVPVITASNGSSTTSSVTVTAVASDAGGSILNGGSYQYSKDNGATWTTATSATSYVFTGLVTGTYQCKVKVADNALNSTISNAVAITTQGIGTITVAANVTGWTNGNVSVTATYPAEVVTKQFSTNGTTWNTYTAAVVVTANSTVYAKGYDAGGNQTSQVSITIANIDKILPTVVYGTNGANNVGAASTIVTVSDTGGSALNSVQYVWATQNTVTPVSGWVAFTNASTITKAGPGTYYLWIKAIDNAGNITNTCSNAFVTIAPIYNFNYTGSSQTFTVPYAGIYKIEVWGAQGGNALYNSYGGNGGYSRAEFTYSIAASLQVNVGAQGLTTNGSVGGRGGEASDIRFNGTALTNRIIVAGGGGGSSYNGDPVGLSETGGTGGGANQNGSDSWKNGTYIAGIGATTTSGYSLGFGEIQANDGGSGGNGYYGGFAGPVMGGGGGSGYVNTSIGSNIFGQSGTNAGNGKIVITYIDQ